MKLFLLSVGGVPSMPSLEIRIHRPRTEDARIEAARIAKQLVKANYTRFDLFEATNETGSSAFHVCDLIVTVAEPTVQFKEAGL